MRLLPLLLLASTTLLSASASELSRVKKTPTGSYRMMVDGHPYLILGAQVRNSCGWPEQLEKAWPLYKQLHANTAEIPVYWEVIEPQPGHFDFNSANVS